METPPAGEAEQLSPSQQEALEQFMAVTNEDEAASLAILRRSRWSVPVAIAKFFDGEDAIPDLDALPQPQVPPQHGAINPDVPFQPGPIRPSPFDTFQMAVHAVNENNQRVVAERTEVARRIVPPPPNPVWRPPFLIAVLLSPLHLGYRIIGTLWRFVQYILGFVPGLVGFGASNRLSGRRQLKPRDAAARFKREFEQMYDSKALPFQETSYAQAYDKAKNEPMYLLVVLLSPEHDDTSSFVRNTLLSPEVVEVINDPANNIILWGGNVRDVEAYQVSQEFKATKFPFSAVVCVTPKEGGSTRMGTVKRMMGPIPPQVFATQLRSVIHKYADDLAAVRAVRVANETNRNIRAEQDDAYERSLARDRERARQRQEAERLAREREAEAARQEQLSKQWHIWRAANLPPEPAAGTPNVVRVALKLPESRGGERVRRSFAGDATVEDLYAFVECHNLDLDEDADGMSEKATKPADYTYEYKFRIASVMPREVHEPSETKTLLEAIGKSASLVVEDVEEPESSDDAEEEEDGENDGRSEY